MFKGTGFYTFLKLKYLLNPNSYKKVVGFDFFNTEELLGSITDKNDAETMKTLFDGREFEHGGEYVDYFKEKLLADGFNQSDFDLIAGDVSETTKKYVDDNVGFRISLLYMDVDLEKPTYDTLVNLWDNITKGGIIVFDEYAYNKWSESKGVDRFISERDLEIKTLDYQTPTAYIKKVK